MNTITTNKATAKSSSELVIMLFICAIGLFGAFSLMSPDQGDSNWQSQNQIQQDVLTDQNQQNETIVLD